VNLKIVVVLRIVYNVILLMISLLVKILNLKNVWKRLKVVMKVGMKLKINMVNVTKMLSVIHIMVMAVLNVYKVMM